MNDKNYIDLYNQVCIDFSKSKSGEQIQAVLANYSNQLAQLIGERAKNVGIPIDVVGNQVHSPWAFISLKSYLNQLKRIFTYCHYFENNDFVAYVFECEKNCLKILQRNQSTINIGRFTTIEINVDMIDFDNPVSNIIWRNWYIQRDTPLHDAGVNLPLEMGRDFVRGKTSLETIFTWLKDQGFDEKNVLKN